MRDVVIALVMAGVGALSCRGAWTMESSAAEVHLDLTMRMRLIRAEAEERSGTDQAVFMSQPLRVGSSAGQTVRLVAADSIRLERETRKHLPVSAPPDSRQGPDHQVTLLLALQRTTLPRGADTPENAHRHHLRSVARLIWLRGREDANFLNKTKNLAHAMSEDIRGFKNPAELALATTGEEFLDALVSASKHGPVRNMVLYGHSASNALYMLEDRGFYRAVSDAAEGTQLAAETSEAKEQELRARGARGLADLERLVLSGEVRFARDAVIVFAGCDAAGRIAPEPTGIAAELARVAGATVYASLGVTDQSMAPGRRPLPENEYSRRTWVRFARGAEPEKLNFKVLDVLKHLIPDGESNRMTVGPSRPSEILTTPGLHQFRCAATSLAYGRSCEVDPAKLASYAQ
jgi:hypothetical protein